MAEVIDDQADKGELKKAKSLGTFGFIVILLLVLALFGGLLFYLDLKNQGHQQELGAKLNSELTKKDQQVMELTQQISGYQTQIAAIQSQLANVQQDTSGKETHYNQALDDYSKLFNEKLDLTKTELKTSIDQIQRLLGKTKSDWLLADAEFLLNVANERLQLVGDVMSAKQALETADSRLRESEDPGVLKVREQIAKEKEELAKVKPLDLVDLFSRISVLQQSADKLTLFMPHVKSENSVSEKGAPETEKTGEEWLDNTIKDMKDFVSIRHSSTPIKTILGQEEVQFIVSQLKVRLEMVKMALMLQNESLYGSGIDSTRLWLKENFIENDAAKIFIKQLDDLQAIKIRTLMPSISESLKLLKDITKHRSDSDKILPKISQEAPKAPISSPAQPETPIATQNANVPVPVQTAAQKELSSTGPVSPAPVEAVKNAGANVPQVKADSVQKLNLAPAPQASAPLATEVKQALPGSDAKVNEAANSPASQTKP